MAEFTEVLRQAQRLCEYFEFKCRGCPLVNDDGCSILLWKWKDVDEIEKCVMTWAKEHSEPQYPTWREWLERKALVKMKPVFANMTNTVEYVLTDEAGEQIPADIAEKLGIEPKGEDRGEM